MNNQQTYYTSIPQILKSLDKLKILVSDLDKIDPRDIQGHCAFITQSRRKIQMSLYKMGNTMQQESYKFYVIMLEEIHDCFTDYDKNKKHFVDLEDCISHKQIHEIKRIKKNAEIGVKKLYEAVEYLDNEIDREYKTPEKTEKRVIWNAKEDKYYSEDELTPEVKEDMEKYKGLPKLQ